MNRILYICKQKIKDIPYLMPLYWTVLRPFVRRNQNILNKKLAHIYQCNLRKIRVGFLVTENEKWGCQSLFDKLRENPHFEPVIILSSLSVGSPDILEEKFRRNLAFFQRVCGNVIEAYDLKNHTFRSLNSFGVDILFYQQPWGIAKEQNILSISKFALPCYLPYSFANDVKKMKQNLYSFHRLLFREYVSHLLVEQEYIRAGLSKMPIKVVGYPKLESYLKRTGSCGKKYVIYAPHHSIEPTSLRLGTFAWNGLFMLEYAKKHPEFHWIFKPHPRCRESLVTEGLFKSRQELDAYYHQWSCVGDVYETGNYMELFQQARCLITDCGSFLVEFFPTGQPVIHLKRTDSNYNAIMSEIVSSTYYPVLNLSTLKQTLKEVLEEKKDPLREERMKKLSSLRLLVSAADNIIQDFEDTFSGKR